MSSYPVPAQATRAEIEVLKSRFIASLAPCFSVEEARQFIARIRREFPDATHHVPVYRIGYESSEVLHCSDDGEPAGTAGRPVLAVLRGSGFGDVGLVVSRYFGGTKLGTGGLVHAYSEAARQVLSRTPRAQKLRVHTVLAVFPYRFLERVRLLAAKHTGQVLDETFTQDITMTLQFPVEAFPGFQANLRELSNGAWEAEIIETGEILAAWPGTAK
jgi:uncharacterized YigZ family protein